MTRLFACGDFRTLPRVVVADGPTGTVSASAGATVLDMCVLVNPQRGVDLPYVAVRPPFFVCVDVSKKSYPQQLVFLHARVCYDTSTVFLPRSLTRKPPLQVVVTDAHRDAELVIYRCFTTVAIAPTPGALNLRMVKVPLPTNISCKGQDIQLSHRYLRVFDDVGGRCGIFACGTTSVWAVCERGWLRVLPDWADGPAEYFSSFHNVNCARGFVSGTSTVRLFPRLCLIHCLQMFMHGVGV